jgi:hypothetical protein
MQITLKSGLNALTIDAAAGTSVGSLITNGNYAAVLGYDASNVEAYISGVKVDSGASAVEGDVIVIQQKAHSKAA